MKYKNILGRESEIKTLGQFLKSKRPEFLAIYGRRRVGKTFLIKEFFSTKRVEFFNVTGLKKGSMQEQIKHFTVRLSEVFYKGIELTPKKNWDDTFDLLTKTIKEMTRTNKQLFIVLISANGIKKNKYSDELLSGIVTLDDLFKDIQ